MSEDQSIQHKASFKNEAGFAYEDGERVPIVGAEFFTDEASASGESAQLPPLCLSVDMTFDLIIPGAKDSKERDLRLLFLAMRYNHRAAPKSKTELAMWLGVPRSSVDRLWERVSQHLQGEMAHLWKSHAMVDGQHKFAANAAGTKPGTG